MAAFSSNIDITSGGTYAMDVTNGETSSKVATDLNGKFANIQELLQNGLPEVWTGSSLPDSLPNGKLIYQGNNLYQSDLLRLLTEKDYDNIINSSSKIEVISYVGTGTYGESNPNTITCSFPIKAILMIASQSFSRYGSISGYLANTYIVSNVLSTSYTADTGLLSDTRDNSSYGKISSDYKQYSWYAYDADYQFNSHKATYYVLVFG